MLGDRRVQFAVSSWRRVLWTGMLDNANTSDPMGSPRHQIDDPSHPLTGSARFGIPTHRQTHVLPLAMP